MKSKHLRVFILSMVAILCGGSMYAQTVKEKAIIDTDFQDWTKGSTATIVTNFSNETITALAGKYKKSPAQIILRWQIQAGYIAIPGSSNPDHIKEDLDLLGFALTDEETAALNSLDQQAAYYPFQH